MKFTTNRETLLKPLQLIIGAVERRQTMPILGNFLFRIVDGSLVITATDLELELSVITDIAPETADAITVPGRKLLEICKSLPDSCDVTLTAEGDKVIVTSKRSRFSLSTLPANDFPLVDSVDIQEQIQIDRDQFREMINTTAFAMAQQDVRYYLNGLMLETDDQKLRAVATDGHRLALREMALEESTAGRQVIVPRKAVQELLRIAASSEGSVDLGFGTNHIQVKLGNVHFVSKLVDGKFPEYQRVIPDSHDVIATVDRDSLKQALMRASILSNEKYRGIRLGFTSECIRIQAHNPEQEEAQEEIEVDYSGGEIEIGFNVGYLLDVLAAIDSDDVHMHLKDSNSSLLIQSPSMQDARYVIMPMRL